MKSVLIAVGLSLVASLAAADPIEGLWQTQADDGAYALVKIAPCGAAYCGTMVKAFNAQGEYASPNLGRKIVIDMMPKGAGKYEGQVWRPSNDKVYVGKIALQGSAMKLSGCVAGGLICAKQNWQKVE